MTILEASVVERTIPKFVQAVSEAEKGNAKIVMMLDAFYDEPDLLYLAVQYAGEHGVSLIFTA